MLPDNIFARPKSSYERPAPLVLVDPDVDVNWTVCFRSEWLPYVTGALTQLLAQTTWDTDDLDTLNLVQARAQLLIAQFMEGCPVSEPDTGCVIYPPHASFISYYPQNPYTQPGYVPDWYAVPPFVVIDSTIVADYTGFQVGDVVANNAAFPTPGGIIDHGLSDIRLQFVGAGTVEIEFVTIGGGSVAAVTIDDDGSHTRFVDTFADIIAVPPETPGSEIEKFEITGSGPHHIDIRFTPTIDDSTLIFRYGGGLRSVSLCGGIVFSDGGSSMFPVGTVISNAGAVPPTGWLACDGAAVSRTTYADLFFAIGSVYGAGDGLTTFNVPDLRGRSILGVGSGAGLTARALGDTGGAEAHTLTTAETPAHTHAGPSHTHAGPSHSHDLSAHTHAGPSHTHAGPSHSHDLSAHTHAGPSHSHDLGNHSHNIDHTHTVPYKSGSTGSGTLAAESQIGTTTGSVSTSAASASDSGVPSTNATGASGTGVTGAPSTDATNASGTGATGSSGTGNTGAPSTDATSASGTGATGSSGTGDSGSAGGGGSHSIMNPFAALNYIIKA